jgi:hypothetical protein
MIKLIWISDSENKGILFKSLKRFCTLKDYNNISGKEAEKIIEDESTDFLYLNIERPANTDVMNRLCLRNIIRLRVSVFKSKPVKSRILKFLFPEEIIKAIGFNIISRYQSSSEKEITT